MKQKRQKGAFMRMCSACNKRAHKDTFLRIIRTPGGELDFDLNGLYQGRGAYVCKNPDCIKILRKSGRLKKMLKGEASDSFYDLIEKFTENDTHI